MLILVEIGGEAFAGAAPRGPPTTTKTRTRRGVCGYRTQFGWRLASHLTGGTNSWYFASSCLLKLNLMHTQVVLILVEIRDVAFAGRASTRTPNGSQSRARRGVCG